MDRLPIYDLHILLRCNLCCRGRILWSSVMSALVAKEQPITQPNDALKWRETRGDHAITGKKILYYQYTGKMKETINLSLVE